MTRASIVSRFVRSDGKTHRPLKTAAYKVLLGLIR